MERKNKKNFLGAICMLAAFIAWTVLVKLVDVDKIGPQGSSVGLAALNGFVHKLTGTNMILYTVTDWLGIVPIGFALGFAFFGLAQWIKRKRITSVDRSILLLGAYYVVLMAVYLLFEELVINYRPVLVEGRLEASYPSSTTMLAMSVMPTVMMQLNMRTKKRALRRCLNLAILAFIVFIVAARLISGVHWFSDIVGGFFISASLVLAYRAAVLTFE